MTEKYVVIIAHGNAKNVSGLIRHVEALVEKEKLDYYAAFEGPINEVDDVKLEIAKAMHNIWKKHKR